MMKHNLDNNEGLGFDTFVVQVGLNKFQGSFRVGSEEIVAIADANSMEEAHLRVLIAVRSYFRNYKAIDIK
jgi:hypothetical protein